MGVFHARIVRQKQRQKAAKWLGGGGLALLLVVFIFRHRDAASDGSGPTATLTELGLVHRRTLREMPVRPGVDSAMDAYHLIVLTPGGAGPSWQPDVILPAVSAVASPVEMTWHTGGAAAAVAPYLAIETLPAAVLVHPFCTITRCDEFHVWQPRTGSKIPPAEQLATWLGENAHAWLLLANDFGDTVVFYQHPPGDVVSSPDGKTDAVGGDAGSDAPARLSQNEHILPSGSREWVLTPLQTTWSVWGGAEGRGPLLQRHVTRGDSIMTVRRPGECNFFTEPGCQVPRPNKHFSAKVLAAREEADQGRLEDIRNQSATIRQYTLTGFDKRRAPPALFAALHSYFEAQAANYSREEWDAEDIFVNHEQSQFLQVDIPENGPMRQAIFDTMQPIFEEWAGGIKLRPTAIYGVRVYTRDCMLRDHVDVAETHHISAIVNVDQDLGEPWPLEIFDHQNKSHQALLDPGEMLLYEGATCAHGRPQPMKGNFMANVFIHMAPA